MYSTNTNTPRPKRLITTSLIGAMAAAFCISAANATMTFTDRADFHAAAEADGIESMFGDSFEGDVAHDWQEQVFTSAAGVTYSGYVGVFESGGWAGGSPTDGGHFLGVRDNPYLTIDLPMPAQALGFDVIDFGDWPGSTGVLILTLENGESMTAAISGGPDGNVQFFGLLSPVAFTNVVLYSEAVSTGDAYCIDYIEYGGVPAPGVIAALGLAGIVGQRRRRRSP